MLDNDFISNSINETELYEEVQSSSLKSKPIILFEKADYFDDSSVKNEFEDETPKIKQREISSLEKKLIEGKTVVEQKKIDELIIHLTSQMINSLRYFTIDELELTSAERLALEIEKKYSARILGEVLQSIYIKYNDFPNMLLGICKSMGLFELNEVMPWGPTILVGLLSHKNENVKEYAVSVVENWLDKELLPILKNLDCSSKWLKEYIQDVVKMLEEC